MSVPRPLLSLIVPCWNEEQTVRQFYSETAKVIAEVPADFEWIFIDDGSTDRTFSELKGLADADPRIRILRLSRNFGSYSAISAGLHHCSGDAAICISVDLQDPPSLISKLFGGWEDGFDIVWAVRQGRDDPLLTRAFARLFYSLMRSIALPDLPKEGMDVGLFSRRVVDIYKALPERDSIPFLTIFKLGFSQARIEYRRLQRAAGLGGWPFWKRVRTAVDVIITFSYAPVRLVSAVGFFVAVCGLIYALLIVMLRLIFAIGVEGWASVMVVLLVVSGIQLLTLGFIAEYLWRQSRHIRLEPRYIVMEDYGASIRQPPPNPIVDLQNINVGGKRAAAELER